MPNYLHTVEEIMANPDITDEQHRASVDVAFTAASDNVAQHVPPAPDTSRELVRCVSPSNEPEAQSTSFQDARDVNCPFKNMSYPGDGDDDVLPYPEPISRKKTVNKSGQLKYFVLTVSE